MRSMPSIRRILASLSSTTRILALRMSAVLTMAFFPISSGSDRRFSGGFQRHVEGIHELIDSYRFGEIPEESRQQAFLNIAGHCIGAECNHGNVRRGRVVAKDC